VWKKGWNQRQSKTMPHLMAISLVGVASCSSIPFLGILFYQQIPSLHILSFQTLHYFFTDFPPQQNHSLKPLSLDPRKKILFFCYYDVKKKLFLPRWLFFNDVPDSFYVFFLYVLL
jgi:hypothetical protein